MGLPLSQAGDAYGAHMSDMDMFSQRLQAIVNSDYTNAAMVSNG